MRAIVLVGALAAGCTAVENGPATDPSTTLDEPAYRCNVQPVLIRQCSYLACHGQAGAALRVYSPGKLRAATPADGDALVAPLTDAEQHGNFTSATGFAADTAPVDNWLLRKPLPENLGGYEHEGGAIYAGTGDADYLAIAAWLEGTSKCR